MTELIRRASERFTITKTEEKTGSQVFLTVPKNQGAPLITWLRDAEGFSHLIMLTCVDWPERDEMVLHYLLHNYESGQDMGVLISLEREKPVMDDLHHLWAQMGTYQRELYEMFGVEFPGSPRMEEPFFLESWTEVPPMRRDFDTRAYSEERFFPRPGRSTNNPAEEMRKKLYPGRAEL